MKCCQLSAAQLRHRVTVQEQIDTPDGMGGRERGWRTTMRIMAKVTPKAGKESERDAGLKTEQAYTLHCRHTEAITPKHRLLFGTLVLDVKAVRDLELMGRWLEIDATQGGGQ